MPYTTIPKSLFCLAVAGTTALPLSAANLILNGDFSGGTSGTFAAGSATASNSVPDSWTGFATGTGALFRTGNAKVNFNGQNRPVGNYIEQGVTTLTNRWYVLDWDQTAHTGGDNAGVVVTTTLTSGAATTGGSYRGLASPQTLIKTASTSTTVRLSDLGASTNSLDTRIDNVTFDFANGQHNIAHLATLSSDSQYPGLWGREEDAVDGRTGGADNTVFHNWNSSSGWLDLDFSASDAGSYIDRIELAARSGFNSRKGDTIEIYARNGALIESIDITGADGASSYAIDGVWRNVGRIRIAESGEFLNVAEARVFSSFVDGVAIPEPSSSSLLAAGGMALLLRRRRS